MPPIAAPYSVELHVDVQLAIFRADMPRGAKKAPRIEV